jgi:hypothetical protein
MQILRFLIWTWLLSTLLFLCGCSGGSKEAKEADAAVSEEMQQTVAGSPALPVIVGRTYWEADPGSGDYWVTFKVKNEGEAGTVAARAALKMLVPYVGLGTSPTEPIYFDMEAGETTLKRIDGKCPQKLADKAVGCNIELYPKPYAEEPESE